MNEYQVSLASCFEEADRTAIKITIHLKAYYQERLDAGLEFNLNFVIRELLNNAVEHGNQFDQEKRIDCKIIYDKKAIILEVTDEGEGIKPLESIPADFSGAGEPLQNRQRGLWLAEKLGFTITSVHSTVKATYYFIGGGMNYDKR